MTRPILPTSRFRAAGRQRKALACQGLGAWEVFALMPPHT